ncbi:hypothetical protein Tco_0735361 [Tanacetum coccineum]
MRCDFAYFVGKILGGDQTSLCIVDLRFQESEIGFGFLSMTISGVARVDVRTYLLGGAIDDSEANGIIRDPKLELESSCFTFDLVPLSYESVDVIVGENWLLRHKYNTLCFQVIDDVDKSAMYLLYCTHSL